MDKKEKLECFICEKKCEVLIEVKVAGDTYFSIGKGICEVCFKNGEIEAKTLRKCKNFCKNQIEHHKDAAKHWKEELKKI